MGAREEGLEALYWYFWFRGANDSLAFRRTGSLGSQVRLSCATTAPPRQRQSSLRVSPACCRRLYCTVPISQRHSLTLSASHDVVGTVRPLEQRGQQPQDSEAFRYEDLPDRTAYVAWLVIRQWCLALSNGPLVRYSAERKSDGNAPMATTERAVREGIKGDSTLNRPRMRTSQTSALRQKLHHHASPFPSILNDTLMTRARGKGSGSGSSRPVSNKRRKCRRVGVRTIERVLLAAQKDEGTPATVLTHTLPCPGVGQI